MKNNVIIVILALFLTPQLNARTSVTIDQEDNYGMILLSTSSALPDPTPLALFKAMNVEIEERGQIGTKLLYSPAGGIEIRCTAMVAIDYAQCTIRIEAGRNSEISYKDLRLNYRAYAEDAQKVSESFHLDPTKESFTLVDTENRFGLHVSKDKFEVKGHHLFEDRPL